MILFRKKPKKAEKSQTGQPLGTVRTASQLISDDLRAWRGVGEVFEYLGIKMAVTSYGNWSCFAGFPPITAWICELSANYVDNNGVIQRVTFRKSEAMALMANQPRKPPRTG